MNRLTGAGIAALACRACLRREYTEAGNRYFVAGFEAVHDGVDDALNSALSVGLS